MTTLEKDEVKDFSELVGCVGKAHNEYIDAELERMREERRKFPWMLDGLYLLAFIGAYLSFIVSVVTMFDKHPFSPYPEFPYVMTAMFVCTGCMTVILVGNLCSVNWEASILQVPISFVFAFLALSFAGWMAIGSSDYIWSVVGRGVIVIMYTGSTYLRSVEKEHSKKLERDLERITLKAIEQHSRENSPEELAKPRCTICKGESQYDICLLCEKTFQGERHRVRAQILRAKQSGVPATLTLAEWLDTLQVFHNRCAYCYGTFQVMEHYVPITQGGGTTKENCVPACFKCNSKKSGDHPENPIVVKRTQFNKKS